MTSRRFSWVSADFTSGVYHDPLFDIGLNEAEVIALGSVALGADRPGFDLIDYFDRDLPNELQTEYCLYSTGDVIAAIREIQQHGEQAQPPSIPRLLFNPLRVICGPYSNSSGPITTPPTETADSLRLTTPSPPLKPLHTPPRSPTATLRHDVKQPRLETRC